MIMPTKFEQGKHRLHPIGRKLTYTYSALHTLPPSLTNKYFAVNECKLVTVGFQLDCELSVNVF